MKPWTQKARERKQICPECRRLVPRKDWKETLKRGHCPICFIAHRGVSLASGQAGVRSATIAKRMRRLSKGETKMTPIPARQSPYDAAVECLQPPSGDVDEKDALAILKAQKRLLRLKKKFGSWLKVEAEIHINHGHMSALVNHGTVPRSKEFRVALGLPRVLPSERKPRKPRSRLEGSPCRGCAALREFRARKRQLG
jgi:hypothetical protein